ncbi:LEM-3-like GIY-YIG domain-containing protein [Nitrobacter sp. JJSN]|uniref:LEM-3-like GIY-YIG domain-containing protein n=1 Tax=Nitrobacter sp. JJSN TaxID=3453033 RepID=UPI003F75DBCB
MEYYVYVYIDPRNYEEFYFGKGKGSRKDAHLTATSDSEKATRIAAIHGAGLKPIIRVIARDLSEAEALLIEKTLLWKLGRQLTNVSSGHYAEKFRPHDKMHLELSGFDFKSGVYYFNVGEGPHRKWADNKNFGFISAGQGKQWGSAISGFREGDIVAAYLKGRGFVGIGRIEARAKPIRDVKINNKPLIKHDLVCRQMTDNIDSDEKCEYVALVDWIKSVDAEKAKWKPNSGIYTTTHVRASLDGQPETKKFLEAEFSVNFAALAK